MSLWFVEKSQRTIEKGVSTYQDHESYNFYSLLFPRQWLVLMIPKTSLFAYNTRKYTHIKGKKKGEHVGLNEAHHYL